MKTYLIAGVAGAAILGAGILTAASYWAWQSFSGKAGDESSLAVAAASDTAPASSTLVWRFEDVLEIFPEPRSYAYERGLGLDADNQPAQLETRVEGARLSLVNYWATWCAPCKEEMPSLDALAASFADQGLQIVASSVDAEPRRAFAWAEAEGLEHLEIAVAVNTAAEDAPRVGTLPMTFIVNAQGETIGQVAAPLDWNSSEVRAWVQAYLDAL